MTTSEKVSLIVAVELNRHAAFINDPNVAVRSMSIVIKLTPSGDPRAVIATFETERTYDPTRPPAEPVLPPTMGRQR